jgi:glycine cleavage system H protein
VWARREPGGDVRVGFTHVPCSVLADVVYVELPAPGIDVRAGEPIGLVESSSAVWEVAAPVSGIVAEGNPALESSPEKITTDPFGDGWLLVIRPSDPAEPETLLDSEEYGRYAGTEP